MALAGPRARDPRFGKVTSNTMAAVVRVLLDGAKAVLLASDIDGTRLRDLLRHGRELSAEVLVFPHHGGLPGSAEPVSFARALTAAVEPRLVVFSMGTSGRTANPRKGIIQGVREAAPDAYIACTQLSVHCQEAGSPPTSDDHLSEAMARGRSENRCCAGSIVVTRTGSGFRYTPPLPQHARFLDSLFDPMCRASLSAFPSQRSPSAARTPAPPTANPTVSGGG